MISSRLAREHEEVLLVGLPVVHPHRLAALEHVEVDPDLRELVVVAERADAAASLSVAPPSVAARSRRTSPAPPARAPVAVCSSGASGTIAGSYDVRVTTAASARHDPSSNVGVKTAIGRHVPLFARAGSANEPCASNRCLFESGSRHGSSSNVGYRSVTKLRQDSSIGSVAGGARILGQAVGFRAARSCRSVDGEFLLLRLAGRHDPERPSRACRILDVAQGRRHRRQPAVAHAAGADCSEPAADDDARGAWPHGGAARPRASCWWWCSALRWRWWPRAGAARSSTCVLQGPLVPGVGGAGVPARAARPEGAELARRAPPGSGRSGLPAGPGRARRVSGSTRASSATARRRGAG